MKEKWQSIRGFFRKNSRKLIPLLLLAAILLPIVVDNSYVLGICTKILLYMLLASSVNVINGYSGQFAIGHAGFLCVGAYTAAILMARANVPFFLAMLGAGVMTALFGMLVSFPMGRNGDANADLRRKRCLGAGSSLPRQNRYLYYGYSYADYGRYGAIGGNYAQEH